MRLKPIEQPKGLWMRFAFWMTRRQLGKVLTPMKVLYPRMPGVLKLSYEIQKFENSGLHLDPGLHFLVATLVSDINGCSFCVDISRAMAVRKHLEMEKLNGTLRVPDEPAFFRSRARRPLLRGRGHAPQACLRFHLRDAPQTLQRGRDRGAHLAQRRAQLLQPHQLAPGNRIRRPLRDCPGGDG